MALAALGERRCAATSSPSSAAIGAPSLAKKRTSHWEPARETASTRAVTAPGLLPLARSAGACSVRISMRLPGSGLAHRVGVHSAQRCGLTGARIGRLLEVPGKA
jgi:hypothetical protein